MNKKIAIYLSIPVSVIIEFVALLSLLNPQIYQNVLKVGTINTQLQNGSVAQDIITVPLAAILFIDAILAMKSKSMIPYIVMLGLLGNFFYGYGLYVVQGMYTCFYLLYLIVFSMSLYGLIFGFIYLGTQSMKSFFVRPFVRNSVVVFVLLMICMLTISWIGKMLQDMHHFKPGATYGVFIFDLAIVFPGLAIIIAMMIRKKALGFLLGGFALVKITLVCLNWGFAQWYLPIFHRETLDTAMTGISTILFAAGGLLSVLYFTELKKHVSICDES